MLPIIILFQYIILVSFSPASSTPLSLLSFLSLMILLLTGWRFPPTICLLSLLLSVLFYIHFYLLTRFYSYMHKMTILYLYSVVCVGEA